MIKFPNHKCGLYLHHNEHKDYYQTIEEAHEEIDTEDWVSDDERKKSLEINEIWELQWYPSTPIGSYVFYASTLEALMKAANQLDQE